MKSMARSSKDIGHIIRRERRLRKLTQKQLADHSGVWQETVSKIENGVGDTKLETVFNILAALDFEIQIQDRSKGSVADFEEIF